MSCNKNHQSLVGLDLRLDAKGGWDETYKLRARRRGGFASRYRDRQYIIANKYCIDPEDENNIMERTIRMRKIVKTVASTNCHGCCGSLCCGLEICGSTAARARWHSPATQEPGCYSEWKMTLCNHSATSICTIIIALLQYTTVHRSSDE